VRKIVLPAAGVAVLLMVTAASTMAAVRHGPGVAAGSARRVGMEIMVPAYWYQGTPSWKTLATMHNPRPWHGGNSSVTVSEAIFNPCTPGGKTCSPGVAPNPAARRDMRAAQANRVTFYGYVWTNYGRVPAGTVRKEVREYASWYGLRGIFFDGASTSCVRESSYYLPLYRYVRSRHGKVILNPGTQPPACYMRAADQISVFEGTGAQFAAYAPAAWMNRYGVARFIAIVHTTAGAGQMARAVSQAGQRDHIGNVYVTGQTVPNPYAKLPAYWQGEVTKVSKSYAR
jgi:hypothetical protein